MTNKKYCSHCLQDIDINDSIQESIDGQDLVFCCTGCQGVYHMINDSGLDKFYEDRKDWTKGPPEKRTIYPELFDEHVKAGDEEWEIDINVSGIRCASCIWLIEHYLKKSEGITFVRVNYATHRAKIKWLNQKIQLSDILNSLNSIGYVPVAHSDYENILEAEKKDLIIRFGTASFFSMQLMLYTIALYAGYFQGIEPLYKKLFQVIAWLLATPVLFYSGFPFIRNTLKALKHFSFNMDSLVFLGSFTAYGYSIFMVFKGDDVYFDTSAMIITLILLGRLLESSARAKASEVISKLMKLKPKQAKVVGEHDHEQVTTIPVSKLNIGNLIKILPGDNIPIDGLVIDGPSEVDESMLTGESRPIFKGPNSKVFAGTINLNGALVIKVLKREKDTVLTNIINTVENTLAQKTPLQTISDKIAGVFIPIIIFIALCTIFVWKFFLNATFDESVMYGVSVLVIACPCAIGLATPMAMLQAVSVLFSNGVAIKGGSIIESISRADCVVFDKTGTLTKGVLTISDIAPYNMEEEQALLLAASLEQNSPHLIGRAIEQKNKKSPLLPVDNFKIHPGKGVEGIINNEITLIGNLDYLKNNNVVFTKEQINTFNSLAKTGKTTVGLAVEKNLKVWLAMYDQPRQEAKELVNSLKKEKFTVKLLTGDDREAALNIARSTGIAEKDVTFKTMPQVKEQVIKNLKSKGHNVIMVGDGINDAIALIQADVGVSMKQSSDITLESADVTLMRNDLMLVPFVINVSKKTVKLIKINLFWAFSYNIIAVPLACSGLIHPIISSVLMAFSSLAVVVNSASVAKKKYLFS